MQISFEPDTRWKKEKYLLKRQGKAYLETYFGTSWIAGRGCSFLVTMLTCVFSEADAMHAEKGISNTVATHVCRVSESCSSAIERIVEHTQPTDETLLVEIRAYQKPIRCLCEHAKLSLYLNATF